MGVVGEPTENILLIYRGPAVNSNEAASDDEVTRSINRVSKL